MGFSDIEEGRVCSLRWGWRPPALEAVLGFWLAWLGLPVPMASFASSHQGEPWNVQSVSRVQGRLWLCLDPNKFIPPSLLSVALRRMRPVRVFYDCASFYYQQEGSFCNLCMVISWGEGRVLTERVGAG